LTCALRKTVVTRSRQLALAAASAFSYHPRPEVIYPGSLMILLAVEYA
jgi:hypothetical protein